MPAVRGPKFLADPEREAARFAARLHTEAAAQEAVPPRYVWKGSYWCTVRTGTWPNVTGWAESRQMQRIFALMLARLRAEGVSGPAARRRAEKHARAEMLARTTERKEASDRYYAQLEASTGDDSDPGGEPPATPPD